MHPSEQKYTGREFLNQRQRNASEKLREYNSRRKKKYKRRRKTAVYLVLLLFVCVVCLVLSTTVFFNTNEIKIVGNSRYTAEQVVTASGVKNGDNLLRMNKDKIKSRIISQLPYASDVRIIRELPSSVTIKITEAEPMCRYLIGEERYALLSDTLKIMELTTVENENTALLSGVTLNISEEGKIATTDSDISQKILLDLLTMLKENDIINVTEIRFMSAINTSLIIEDRVTVKLGGNADLDYKLKMVKAYLTNSLPSAGDWTVDVTSGKKLYASRTVIAAPEEEATDVENPEEEQESSEDSEVNDEE